MSLLHWSIKLFAAPIALAAALCLATSSANAALIVNDTWQDGTRTDPASPTYSENGTDSDSDGDLESAWFRGGAGTFDPVGAGGPLRGTGFGGSSASWSTYFTPEGSEVDLANAGDAIRVTWVFTTGNVNATNGSQNFRIALVNAPSASRIVADGTPGGAAYTGYALFGNMGETLGHASPFPLKERINTSALLSASGDWSANLGTVGGTNGNTGYADNTQYTLEWTITRNAADNLDIVATMTGGNINGTGSMTASVLNTAPNGGSYKFDLFGLRPSNSTTTADTFDTNLFRVEFIPEPTSLVLMGLGGLALGWAARRRP
jgi:hypothetical protein